MKVMQIYKRIIRKPHITWKNRIEKKRIKGNSHEMIKQLSFKLGLSNK